MLTQADQSGDTDLLTLLKQFIKNRDNKPGNVYLGMVHRLDRVVAGLIVFAKTSKAASRLSEQIRDHGFNKTYIAEVSGIPINQAQKLTHFLRKDPKTNQVEVSKKDHPGFKKAILSYTILKENKNSSFLEINLVTGRPHQIRSQLSYIGHPIIGDRKYGFKYSNDKKYNVRGIHLFSTQLIFTHPTTKKQIEISILPPWFSVKKK